MSDKIEPVGSFQSTPKAGQTVEHNGTTYTTIKEGLAYILIPPDARTSVDPKAQKKVIENGEKPQNVFYNPIQQFNRDLSVLAIRAFGEDFSEKRRLKAEKRQQQLRSKKERKKAHHVGGAAKDAMTGENGEPPAAESTGSHANTNGTNERKRRAEEVATEDVINKRQKTAETVNAIETEVRTDVETPTNSTEGAAIEGDVLDNGQLAHNENHAAPKPHKVRILDALSATGLRALRYAQELPFDTTIVANDMLTTATAAIAMNAEHNKLSAKIKPSTANAMAHMYTAAYAQAPHEYGKYDVIDLDPYGTAAPFIEGALLALNDDGLLCVTCTDAGVWASCGYVEKSYSLYGGISVRGPHSHEAGLRLILQSIASAAAKHGMAIEPLLSLSIDFYARVFVRVRRSPADVKLLGGKTMLVHQCDSGCGAWTTQPIIRNQVQTNNKGPQYFKHSAAQTAGSTHCIHCGTKTHVAGPMWGGPLHNPFFITRILEGLDDLDSSTYATKARVQGMLTSALDELQVIPDIHLAPTSSSSKNNETTTADAVPEKSSPLYSSLPASTTDPHPFFVIPSALSKVLRCQSPSEAAIKGALRHAGYVATRSHTKPGCVKTQAPWDVIWEIMREWVRQKAPVKEGSLRAGGAGWKIMFGDSDAPKQPTKGDDAVPVGNGAGTMVANDVEESRDGDGGEKANADTETKTKLQDEEKSSSSSRLKVVFDEVLGRDRDAKKLLRYQLNPRANWGPMARAKGPA